jgi:antirestriction protein
MTRRPDIDAPRIYVASLADYNAGRLHGVWIDAAQSAEEIMDEAAEMLKDSREPGAEEWAIHDHEGFYGLPVAEWDAFEGVAELAGLLVEHGPAFAAYVANIGAGADEDGFEEAFVGEAESEYRFAHEHADDLIGDATGLPVHYFNYESYADDLFVNDYWSASKAGGVVYVFRSI